MPCYDPRQDEDNRRNERRSEDADKYEAMLCAIISELEKRGMTYEILSQASKSGKVDCMTFWEHHSYEDEARLAEQLHRFSEHEQDVLRKLLNK